MGFVSRDCKTIQVEIVANGGNILNNLLIYSNVILWVFQLIMAFLFIIIFRQFGEVFLKKSDAIARDGISLGEEIPDFYTKSYYTGKEITKASIANKPTLITFISSSCKPCKELLPDWNSAYDKFGKDINFVLIGSGSKDQFDIMFKHYVPKGNISIDESGLLNDFKVRVTPFGFIIDEEGVVKGKGLCGTTQHIESFISYLGSELVEVESTMKQKIISKGEHINV
jgi:methylamine dehydrogenase accessory protein MauD